MPKRNARVLVVEDDDGLRRTLADILRAVGMKVDTASDAPAACGKLARSRYDVAIVDLALPGPSGVEVIRYIKLNSLATRVFACTAFFEGKLLAEALDLGVELTIYKPADPVLLVQLIQGSAGSARGGRETPNSEL